MEDNWFFLQKEPILHEGISLARRGSSKSENAIPRGVVLPERDSNEPIESFRRHSLEPVSSFRPKENSDIIIEPPKILDSEVLDTRPPKPVLSSFSPIPEMQELQKTSILSSSDSVLTPSLQINSLIGKSLSASSEVSKEASVSNSEEDPLNQLLKVNSILGMPARFGNMEDNISSEELVTNEPLITKKQPEMSEVKSSDHVITMDLSSSHKNEDWMW